MIRVGIVGQYLTFFTKHFTGPMRVVYNLCRSWKKTPEVKIILLPILFNLEVPLINTIGISRLTALKARLTRLDIVNNHGISKTGVNITDFCKSREIPIIYTAHGVASKEKELGYKHSDEFIELERKTVLLSDKIIAVSDIVKDLLMDEYDLFSEKIKVIHNGIDPSFGQKKMKEVNVRKKYNIRESRKILLNVGGTRKVKDIPFLINSLKLLERSDWHLVLVGKKGDAHNEVLEACRKSLGDKYTFTGTISEDELLSFYHHSVLTIISSVYEPFGLTPWEALSCGTDIAIRDTLPLAEIVFLTFKDLYRKYVFSSNRDLANIITMRLQDNRIRKNVKKVILDKNSWELRANDYLEFFKINLNIHREGRFSIDRKRI